MERNYARYVKSRFISFKSRQGNCTCYVTSFPSSHILWRFLLSHPKTWGKMFWEITWLNLWVSGMKFPFFHVKVKRYRFVDRCHRNNVLSFVVIICDSLKHSVAGLQESGSKCQIHFSQIDNIKFKYSSKYMKIHRNIHICKYVCKIRHAGVVLKATIELKKDFCWNLRHKIATCQNWYRLLYEA